ncbi:MAG: alpha amylase C-terminal domain-containing protein, partial [Ghiorsea sp.]|nr:alpha amylase C-terminal domain-containing protein [Ghiorsea sp.]
NFMPHRGLQLMMRDMNHLYKDEPALHEVDFDEAGFQWIDCNDAEQSVLSFKRKDKQGNAVIVVLNLTPVPRENYRLGVPQAGLYKEIMNTDAEAYGGSNLGNSGSIEADNQAWMNQQHSIVITLPPLSCVMLKKI